MGYNFIIHWTQWSKSGILKIINKCMLVNIETTFNSTLSMTQSEHKFADILKIRVHSLIHVKTKKLINTNNLLIKIGKFSLVTFNKLLKKVIKLFLSTTSLFCSNSNPFLTIHDINDFVKQRLFTLRLQWSYFNRIQGIRHSHKFTRNGASLLNLLDHAFQQTSPGILQTLV